MARGRPDSESEPAPALAHSTSRPVSTSPYRLPAWLPADRSAEGDNPSGGDTPWATTGYPPHASSPAADGGRTTTNSAVQTALFQRDPGFRSITRPPGRWSGPGPSPRAPGRRPSSPAEPTGHWATRPAPT